MKSSKIIVLGSLILAVSLCSCESRTYDDIASKNVTNPTYTANVKAIVDNNCISCHSVNTNSQTPLMDTYSEVKDATENDQVICRIDDQSCGSVMPQTGKMPQATIDIIKLWKLQGCPN